MLTIPKLFGLLDALHRPWDCACILRLQCSCMTLRGWSIGPFCQRKCLHMSCAFVPLSLRMLVGYLLFILGLPRKMATRDCLDAFGNCTYSLRSMSDWVLFWGLYCLPKLFIRPF